MSVVEPGSGSSNLVERVKNIILKPGSTWDEIDREPATIQGLLLGYAAILAAIPAVATLLGGVLLGHSVLGVTWRTPIVSGLVVAVLTYVMALVMVFVIGLIIDALAPSFDGQKNRIQAMKVAVYSYTPGWVAGILGIVPALAPLAIIAGLYGLYILYLGLPKLMKAPQEKAVGYTVVTILVAIVLSIVVGVVTGAVATMGMMASGGIGALGAASPSINVRDGDTNVKIGGMNLNKLEQQAKQMEAAAKQIQSGEAAEVTDPELLKTYLPAQVAGFSRQEVSSSSGGAGGVAGSQAEGKYVRGDARLTLTVVDMGAMGAMAGMMGALGVNATSESNGRYEKVGKDGAGRTTMEEFDRNTGHGKYAVMGARIMVAAEGDGVRIEELKAAVAAANPGRLEQLASKG